LPFNQGEEVQHVIVIPSDSHGGINYPPGRLLWPSADYQTVQTIRPEACVASFQTLEGEHQHSFLHPNKVVSTIPRQLLAGGEMTTSCHF